MKKLTIITSLIFVGCCLSTAAGVFHPSPSNLAGPYDLLGITGAAEDAVIPEEIVLDVSFQRSKDTLDGHTSALVYSAEVPFGESVSLKVDNLCETWKLSSGKTGSDIGEVAVITKFLILKETNSLPALAIKLGFKSAAGDGHSLRFTDSMGALFGLMAARDFHVGETNSVRTMRAFVELGFAVWDNGIDAYGFGGQDDATKFAAGLQFEPGEHIVVRGGIHGLNGWRHNGDTPVSANAAVEYTVSERTSAYMNLDIGLCKDADDYIVGGGLKIRFGKGGLPAPVTSAIPARPARATRTVPSPRPAPITNAVPSRLAPVTRAVRSRPVPVTNAVPSRPVPVTNAIPAQPALVTNAIPAQPALVTNAIPAEPVPVTNAIPAQPTPVTNVVPAQPAP